MPGTIVRPTQFHEFATQMIAQSRHGDSARILDVQVQTVAARTVGEVLVDLAASAPPDALLREPGARLDGPGFE